MGWSAKRISILAGLLALGAEIGASNAVFTGLVYTAASGVAAPIIVRGVIVAHDAQEARLAADRKSFAETQEGGRPSGRAKAEAGDADQPARQSDGSAADSPDMPRRLMPMLIERRSFLAAYGADPVRARPLVADIDRLLTDDRRAFQSFERRSLREPVWAAVHRADLADLHRMDAQLVELRAKLGE